MFDILLAVALIFASCMVTIIALSIAVFILMTLWAFIRPYIASLLDKFWGWYCKRTGM